MQLIINDTATAALELIGAKLKDPTPVLEAAGEAVVGITTRAFNDPSLRVTPWAALQPATVAAKLREGSAGAILKRSTLLFRSFRVLDLTANSVTVGTDRFYARFHQWGSRNGRLPARPMLPLTGGPESPELASFAVTSVMDAARAALQDLLKQ